MKRLISMLLAGALTITLCLAADPEGVTPAPSMDASPQAEETAGADTPAATAQNAAQDTADAANAVTVAATAANTSATADTGTQSGSKTIGFTSIDRTVRQNNLTVKSNDETLAGIGAMDTDAQEIGLSMGYSTMHGLSEKLAGSISDLKKLDGVDEDLISAITDGLAATKDLMDMNAATYQNQLEDLDDDTTIEDNYVVAKKQFQYVADQLVMGAQTLFITIGTLELQQADAQRGLTQLTRTQAEMQKRYDLGQIAELDLLKIQNQSAQTASTIETLKLQIKNLKGDLALLLGMEPTVSLTLSPLPSASAGARNYDADLKAAIKASYDLYFKNDTMKTASNDYEDNKTNTVHAYEAAKIAYQSTEKQLTLTFRKLSDAIPEKQRLYAQAQADEALQQRLFDAAAAKYARGLISKNEYTTEKETLEAKQSAARKAEIDLFTAANQYDWAVRGVVATS
ncbi:MAG: hypothetical protein AB7C89_05605 [Intestinibacillus sp.]